MPKFLNKMTVMGSLLLGFTFSHPTFANPETYTTSTGAVFTQVHQPGFSLDGSNLGWKDPSGRIWSDIIWPSDNVTKRFSNEPLEPDQGNTIVKSPATEACKTIGGKLPSAIDYKELLSNFEKSSSGKLTDLGRKDLESIFNDMGGRAYWTSTTVPNRPDIAWWLYSPEGRIIYTGTNQNRHQTAFVRCVLP